MRYYDPYTKYMFIQTKQNNQQNKITDIYHIISCIKTYWKSLPSFTALTTSSSPKKNIGVFMWKIYQINDA